MDPGPNYSKQKLITIPKGGYAMEWYETLLAIAIWDITRSFFTAWLTKRWILKGPDKRKRNVRKTSKKRSNKIQRSKKR